MRLRTRRENCWSWTRGESFEADYERRKLLVMDKRNLRGYGQQEKVVRPWITRDTLLALDERKL